MLVVNRYIFKNLLLATVFVTVALSAVVVLTQSLRFLELIIESGAGVGSFWVLTFLALPRFLEILIPIAAMIAVLFVYSRLRDHSELVILRSSGFTPWRIAVPAIMLSVLLTCFLWFTTLWAAPSSLAKLQEMRQLIRSQLSVFYLQEGIFNQLGDDYMLYIHRRGKDGQMKGIFMQDQSGDNGKPAIIMARSGSLSRSTDGYQIRVQDGSRQSYDNENKVLQRLDFEDYTVELPLYDGLEDRWQQPDERTIFELIQPDLEAQRDIENLQIFRLEIHRRFATPILCIAFVFIAATSLILSPMRRGGQSLRMVMVVLGCVSLQGFFIALYNIAQNYPMVAWLLYLLPLVPIGVCLFLLMARMTVRQIHADHNETALPQGENA